MTIRRSGMLSEALPTIIIYLSEAMKHSSSNECMSLRHSHSITFPRLIWFSKLVILLEIHLVYLVEMAT